MVGFALVGILAIPPLWYASLPCAALLIAVTRQHVIVDGTGVELHNVVRQYRLVLPEIDNLTVIYSRGWHFGWRIRLHCGPRYVDTFSFGNLVGFRLFRGQVRGTACRRAGADQGAVRTPGRTDRSR
jgi:hypothetical protein